MTDPSLVDVLDALKAINTKITTMESDVAALKDKASSTSASSDTHRHEDARDRDLPPKPKRWDFPRYDGTTDPLLFTNKCDAYFRQYRTMPEECVAQVGYHLDEVAQLWLNQLMEDDGAPPWGRFKDLLHLRFGPPLCSAPLFELSQCKWTGTVEDYANHFQALLPHAGRLDEAHRVQLFTDGLLPPLSHAVQVHNPDSLAVAMSLARQVELMELDRLTQPATPCAPQRGVLPTPTIRPAQAVVPVPAPHPALLAPPQQLALPAPPSMGQQGHGDANQCRLSPDEMVERRRQGLCFNCNENYSRGHNRFCHRIFCNTPVLWLR